MNDREREVLDPGRMTQSVLFYQDEVQGQPVTVVAGEIQWQTGAVADGRNGMLLSEVVDKLIERVNYLQDLLPCQENEEILRKFVEINELIAARQHRRRKQGVLGTMKPHDAGQHPDPVALGAMDPSQFGPDGGVPMGAV